MKQLFFKVSLICLMLVNCNFLFSLEFVGSKDVAIVEWGTPEDSIDVNKNLSKIGTNLQPNFSHHILTSSVGNSITTPSSLVIVIL